MRIMNTVIMMSMMTLMPVIVMTRVIRKSECSTNDQKLHQKSKSPDEDVPRLDVPVSDCWFAAASRDLGVQVTHSTSN